MGTALIPKPKAVRSSFRTSAAKRSLARVSISSSFGRPTLSQDCDLEQDIDLRFPVDGHPPTVDAIEQHPNALSHVLLCDALEEKEIRARVPNFGSKDWKRVDQNQNERYHHFSEAEIGAGSGQQLGGIWLDFRKHVSLPTGAFYEQLAARPNGSRWSRLSIFTT